MAGLFAAIRSRSWSIELSATIPSAGDQVAAELATLASTDG